MAHSLTDLIRYTERERGSDPPDADVPRTEEELAAAGIPAWALTVDTWPERWRRRIALLDRLPASDVGPAERQIQSRFLRALAVIPADRRGDGKELMPE